MLIIFTVSLRTLFVLNTVCVRIFKPYLIKPPSLLGFQSVCLGQRVNCCIQKEDCGLKLKVFGEDLR